MLFNLVGKNLKGKYAGSFLGMFWAFINPLFLALIVGFVFTKILKVEMKNFYLFVIAGMLSWNFLATALQEAVLSIPANASVLKQFPLPREFIPLSCVLTNFALFLSGLLVVLPFFLAVNPKIFFMLPLLIIALLLQVCFVAGLALILSAAYVRFRDIGQLLNTFLLFWLWLTPVFYSMDMIPPEYQGIFICNPMTFYVNLYRHALLGFGDGLALSLLIAFLTASTSIVVGYKVFYAREKDFLKWI